MFYKRVYSPDGKPFDVPSSRANDLILQKGWTQQPVVVEKITTEIKQKKKSKPYSRKKVVVKEQAEPEKNLEADTAEDSSFLGAEHTIDTDD